MTEGMTNGFTFRSWSDVASFILIITFIVSGLVWGMKLESRYDTQDERIKALQLRSASLRAAVDKGILPRAEERIDAIERRLAVIEKPEAHAHD